MIDSIFSFIGTMLLALVLGTIGGQIFYVFSRVFLYAPFTICRAQNRLQDKSFSFPVLSCYIIVTALSFAYALGVKYAWFRYYRDDITWLDYLAIPLICLISSIASFTDENKSKATDFSKRVMYNLPLTLLSAGIVVLLPFSILTLLCAFCLIILVIYVKIPFNEEVKMPTIQPATTQRESNSDSNNFYAEYRRHLGREDIDSRNSDIFRKIRHRHLLAKRGGSDLDGGKYVPLLDAQIFVQPPEEGLIPYENLQDNIYELERQRHGDVCFSPAASQTSKHATRSKPTHSKVKLQKLCDDMRRDLLPTLLRLHSRGVSLTPTKIYTLAYYPTRMSDGDYDLIINSVADAHNQTNIPDALLLSDPLPSISYSLCSEKERLASLLTMQRYLNTMLLETLVAIDAAGVALSASKIYNLTYYPDRVSKRDFEHIFANASILVARS